MSRYGNYTANFKPMDIHSIIELYKFELQPKLRGQKEITIYKLGNIEINICEEVNSSLYFIGGKAVELELLIEALNNIE